MASIEELKALPIEQLERFALNRSLSIVPNTETAPGMTEEGTVADASANLMPQQPDEMAESGINMGDRRRQAVLSRIKNSRDAADSMEGI
ncbi:MAG: hypothetical protein Unbinned80contig1000_17 [Prokaryotic dsDNA virus sp.]|nr:MAG: hypothetical protein Unbinned80contig1000_17 [Prokaryotic dsDNA virus sp.]|tara:strand:- start:10511 stop:10780 length:270 start_codon:yes stop_codon:yes gene_type:complete